MSGGHSCGGGGSGGSDERALLDLRVTRSPAHFRSTGATRLQLPRLPAAEFVDGLYAVVEAGTQKVAADAAAAAAAATTAAAGSSASQLVGGRASAASGAGAAATATGIKLKKAPAVVEAAALADAWCLLRLCVEQQYDPRAATDATIAAASAAAAAAADAGLPSPRTDPLATLPPPVPSTTALLAGRHSHATTPSPSGSLVPFDTRETLAFPSLSPLEGVASGLFRQQQHGASPVSAAGIPLVGPAIEAASARIEARVAAAKASAEAAAALLHATEALTAVGAEPSFVAANAGPAEELDAGTADAAGVAAVAAAAMSDALAEVLPSIVETACTMAGMRAAAAVGGNGGMGTTWAAVAGSGSPAWTSAIADNSLYSAVAACSRHAAAVLGVTTWGRLYAPLLPPLPVSDFDGDGDALGGATDSKLTDASGGDDGATAADARAIEAATQAREDALAAHKGREAAVLPALASHLESLVPLAHAAIHRFCQDKSAAAAAAAAAPSSPRVATDALPATTSSNLTARSASTTPSTGSASTLPPSRSPSAAAGAASTTVKQAPAASGGSGAKSAASTTDAASAAAAGAALPTDPSAAALTAFTSVLPVLPTAASSCSDSPALLPFARRRVAETHLGLSLSAGPLARAKAAGMDEAAGVRIDDDDDDDDDAATDDGHEEAAGAGAASGGFASDDAIRGGARGCLHDRVRSALRAAGESPSQQPTVRADHHTHGDRSTDTNDAGTGIALLQSVYCDAELTLDAVFRFALAPIRRMRRRALLAHARFHLALLVFHGVCRILLLRSEVDPRIIAAASPVEAQGSLDDVPTHHAAVGAGTARFADDVLATADEVPVWCRIIDAALTLLALPHTKDKVRSDEASCSRLRPASPVDINTCCLCCHHPCRMHWPPRLPRFASQSLRNFRPSFSRTSAAHPVDCQHWRVCWRIQRRVHARGPSWSGVSTRSRPQMRTLRRTRH